MPLKNRAGLSINKHATSMSRRRSIFAALQPAGAVLGLVLLSGCATSSSQPVAMDVTSPPPPRTGSAPIAAYDAYASAMYLGESSQDTLVATVSRHPAEPASLIGQKIIVVADTTGSD